MGKAKDILLKPIDARTANVFMRKTHYSGKVVNNSRVHIGVFYHGELEGVLQFGASIDIRRTMGLVKNTGWNEFTELNRLAFTDVLPRNSESRALSISMRLLKKHAPHLKWVLSYADATQCGDGTIYRAAGFVLTGIRKNAQMLLVDGNVIAKKTLDNPNFPKIDGRYYSRVLLDQGIAETMPGHQLRYIYFLDPLYREHLTVPEIPYSKIWKVGAGMYRGKTYDKQRADVV